MIPEELYIDDCAMCIAREVVSGIEKGDDTEVGTSKAGVTATKIDQGHHNNTHWSFDVFSSFPKSAWLFRNVGIC